MPTMLATFGPGLGQQTPAVLQLTAQMTQTRRRATKRRAAPRPATKRRRKKSTKRAGPGKRKRARLVKGSRAAKAYMAKIRKMRRK